MTRRGARIGAMCRVRADCFRYEKPLKSPPPPSGRIQAGSSAGVTRPERASVICSTAFCNCILEGAVMVPARAVGRALGGRAEYTHIATCIGNHCRSWPRVNRTRQQPHPATRSRESHLSGERRLRADLRSHQFASVSHLSNQASPYPPRSFPPRSRRMSCVSAP